jgi:hypothetical protein
MFEICRSTSRIVVLVAITIVSTSAVGIMALADLIIHVVTLGRSVRPNDRPTPLRSWWSDVVICGSRCGLVVTMPSGDYHP